MEQISMFEGQDKFKITQPIRLIELFAGIGSQAKALKNLGIDFEHYRICEFDKYAVASYNAVHGTKFETSDITKITANDLGIVDTDKYCYIMTYSFPCQDLSNAGLGKGMVKGSGTRSGLLWEVERLLDECSELPNILLMENVPQVIGQNNIQHFAKWIEKLEQLGYKNKWQVLNAKDYGIPQNRERCFMVSILGDYYYDFPKTIPLTLRLKDMLEKEVDEKYYLSDRIVNYFINHTKECKENGKGFKFEFTDGDCVAKCVTTRAGGRMDDNFIKQEPNLKRELCNNLVKSGAVEEGDIIRHSYTKSRMQGEMKDIKEKGLCPTLDTRCDCLGVTVKEETDKCNCIGTLQGGKWDKMHDISKRVYSPNGCSPTIHTCGGGNLEPKILEDFYKNRPTRQYEDCSPTLRSERSGLKVIEPKVIGGIGEKKSNGGTQWYQQDRIYDNDVAISVTTSFNPYYKENNYRIRKLTPKECWRLMGFEDKDIDNAIAIGMSNAQLYKQAGNSIVVNVLMAIFSQMI